MSFKLDSQLQSKMFAGIDCSIIDRRAEYEKLERLAKSVVSLGTVSTVVAQQNVLDVC